jgi:hypothetical protein
LCQINCVRELGLLYQDYLKSDIYKKLSEYVYDGQKETNARIKELTKNYFPEDEGNLFYSLNFFFYTTFSLHLCSVYLIHKGSFRNN